MFKRFLFYKNRAPFFLFFCFLYSSTFGQDINCSDNFSLKKKETNISRQKICPDLLLKDVKELYGKIMLIGLNTIHFLQFLFTLFLQFYYFMLLALMA